MHVLSENTQDYICSLIHERKYILKFEQEERRWVCASGNSDCIVHLSRAVPEVVKGRSGNDWLVGGAICRCDGQD